MILAALHLSGQELPRRPLLGVMLQKLDSDSRRVMDYHDSTGVLIKSIVAKSTAEKAGFKIGDVLLRVNDVDMKTPEQAVRYVANSDGGLAFTYELLREGKKITGTSVLSPCLLNSTWVLK